ncbi:MAG: ferrous iron transport protein A [Lachnospiraceae bacterium]
MPLSMAKAGEQVMVARIGGNPEVKKHLEDLGFVTGAEVKIVSAPGDGNVIVMVKDARLAITAEMAKKVMITL